MTGARPGVLVTGASGFIGRHAAACFAARGWRVIGAYHRVCSPTFQAMAAAGTLHAVQADFATPGTGGRLLAHCRATLGAAPEVVVHCAGHASDIGPIGLFRTVNYEAVCDLGQAAADAGSRLVFVSTTDVYGLLDHQRADEDTPLREAPCNPYPRYKIAAEQWLRDRLPRDRWSIVRPGAVWGPDDPTLTPRIVAFLRQSPCIVHFGRWRGRNRWPAAHVDRVSAAIHLAATLPEARGQAVHVVDPEHVTMDAFYRRLAAEYCPGKRFRTLCLPFAVGLVWGAAVTRLSQAARRRRPIADPSLYAVYSVSHNLDFADTRLRAWQALAAHA